MDLPAHPESDDSSPDQTTSPTTSWPVRLAIAALVAVVALIIVLHLTGVVGPAAD